MMNEGFEYEELDKYKTYDPDMIYNIKQSKGYSESTCRQTNVGIEYIEYCAIKNKQKEHILKYYAMLKIRYLVI